MSKNYTVGELIKELQRAIIMEELDVTSEVLNWELTPARISIAPGTPEFQGHLVVE